MKALVLTFLFLLIAPSGAKIFSRCELASVLKQNKLGYNPDHLGQWMCYAYYASKFNTEAVHGRSYGIFQIESITWCSENLTFGRYSRCQTLCSAFTDDDITDDIACAMIIASEHMPLTFFWPWVANCRGKNLSKWIRGCNLFD
ncbi:lysozyme C, milk isozyme-like [Erythrolamprus reginae]|uniref:lysozyme C, milk isozyme-like n=1 Tax=Erythrolamprus reginae TaxID=121349 RepID=UPI00396C7573